MAARHACFVIAKMHGVITGLEGRGEIRRAQSAKGKGRGHVRPGK